MAKKIFVFIVALGFTITSSNLFSLAKPHSQGGWVHTQGKESDESSSPQKSGGAGTWTPTKNNVKKDESSSSPKSSGAGGYVPTQGKGENKDNSPSSSKRFDKASPK